MAGAAGVLVLVVVDEGVVVVVVVVVVLASIGALDSSLLGASVLGPASVAGGAGVVELLAGSGSVGAARTACASASEQMRPTKRSVDFLAILCVLWFDWDG